MKGGLSMKKAGKAIARLTEILEIPGETALGVARVTVTGGRTVHVENHRGLLEYEKDRICVNTSDVPVRIRGTGLEISAMSDLDLAVTGRITCVEYVRQ